MTDSLTYSGTDLVRSGMPARPSAASSGAPEHGDACAGIPDSGFHADPAADSAGCGLFADLPGGDSSVRFVPERRTADTVLSCAASPYRDTTARALFGNEATVVVPDRMLRPLPDSLTENAVFQGFVLLLAATYILMLYHHPGDIRGLLTRISRDTAGDRRLTEEPGASGFSRFLNLVTAVGILFMGVAVVKYGDSLMPRQLAEILPHGAVLVLSLLVSFACVVLAGLQLIAVRAAGAVTISQEFVSRLILLKRIYFSLGVIVASPALLLFALCPRGTGGVWFCAVAIGLTVTAFLYLKETFRLFLVKKISVLHWFLYLCTVEIFPVSFLWLLAAR